MELLSVQVGGAAVVVEGEGHGALGEIPLNKNAH